MSSGLAKVEIAAAGLVVADALREEVLQLPSGTFLGGEEDLAGRLGVSRPTVRQAVRILQQEELLEVRRGPNGGIRTRQPTAAVATHMVGVYLRSRRVEEHDVLTTYRALLTDAAERASRHPDLLQRGRPLQYLEQTAPRPGTAPSEFRRWMSQHALVIAETAGSPSLTLFIQVLDGARQHGHVERFLESMRHQKAVIEQLVALDEAIRRGHSSVAGRLAQTSVEPGIAVRLS